MKIKVTQHSDESWYCLGLNIVSIPIRNNIMARVELCVNLCSA
jgi:hypothetical protein